MTASESYEQRHERAADVFRRFMPEVEPERVGASLERRLGALGSFAFDAVGHLWSRPELSRRDRSLLVLSVLSAQGRDEELELHTQIGLNHGLSRPEIEEILLHIAAYAGFPAALAASRHMDVVFRRVEGIEGNARIEGRRPATKKSDEQRDRDAVDVVRTLNGWSATERDPTVEWMTARLGGVGEIAYRWAFGEIWCRTELSRRDRSIVVISILAALGLTEELPFHVRGGRNHGLTAVELEEMMTHLCLYAGIPRGVNGMRVVREVLGAPAGA
jgi:4-carboxymuconolactone decarboxylase